MLAFQSSHALNPAVHPLNSASFHVYVPWALSKTPPLCVRKSMSVNQILASMEEPVWTKSTISLVSVLKHSKVRTAELGMTVSQTHARMEEHVWILNWVIFVIVRQDGMV